MATDQDKIMVYLPSTESAALRAYCAAEDKTMTAVIRRLIRDFLAATPNQK